MPKLILRFNLPEEQYEAEAASKAQDILAGVTDFMAWIRNQVKYMDIPESKREVLEEVRDQLYLYLNDHDIQGLFE